MDRSRLKNIIIIILLLLNVFLCASLVLRETSIRSAHNRTVEQLTALFAEDDMELSAAAISQDVPPSAFSFTRDPALERKVAAFFLGDGLTPDSRGDSIYTAYTGSLGTAQFRSNGSFDVSGTLSEGNAEAVCRSFCSTFALDAPTFLLDETGTGKAVAAYRYDHLPIYNCTVTFSIRDGCLVAVSGTLLPTTAAAFTAEQTPLSAAAALVSFQQYRRESGASASSVTGTYLCYELQSSATSLSIAPAWCVETDVAKYYVNCITGSVSSS